jgi:hypothetical protein
VVNVVGSEDGANNFLEQVGFLDGAFRGSEARKCFRTVLGLEFQETFCSKAQRFLPGGFPECVRWVLE